MFGVSTVQWLQIFENSLMLECDALQSQRYKVDQEFMQFGRESTSWKSRYMLSTSLDAAVRFGIE